jgi:hypothetical protein
MQRYDVEHRAKGMLRVMASDPELARFIDFTLDMPTVQQSLGCRQNHPALALLGFESRAP